MSSSTRVEHTTIHPIDLHLRPSSPCRCWLIAGAAGTVAISIIPTKPGNLCQTNPHQRFILLFLVVIQKNV